MFVLVYDREPTLNATDLPLATFIDELLQSMFYGRM